MAADSRVWAHINPNVPTIARVYDYWLGGKDNFSVDRELAERFVKANPMVIAGVRSNRAFLQRAVRFLARDVGIRQFLDIGTGIPTANNTHEVAQATDPGCRVVYWPRRSLTWVVSCRRLRPGCARITPFAPYAPRRPPGRTSAV